MGQLIKVLRVCLYLLVFFLSLLGMLDIKGRDGVLFNVNAAHLVRHSCYGYHRLHIHYSLYGWRRLLSHLDVKIKRDLEIGPTSPHPIPMQFSFEGAEPAPQPMDPIATLSNYQRVRTPSA